MARPLFELSKSLKCEVTKQLGTMSDSNLASKYMISRQVITNMRNNQGIPTYNESNWRGPGARPRVDIDWNLVHSLLGKMSDEDIATSVGVVTNTITVRRRKRGIPAYKSKLSMCLAIHKLLNIKQGCQDDA